MAQKNIPYDMTNFFINRGKALFFINLYDVQRKKRTMYQVRSQSKISGTHAQMILSSLHCYGLLDYFYDSEIAVYVVKLTPKGMRLRKKLLDIFSLIKKYNIWEAI